MEFKTILVGIDFSEHADLAVAAAAEFAKQAGGTLHLVHAFELVMPLVSPYEVAVPALYLAESRQVAQQKLDGIHAKLAADGIDVTSHLTDAPAALAIVRIAKAIGADLVVVGTRGITGLKHLVLGSVAERTVRLSPCSVLTVKQPDA